MLSKPFKPLTIKQEIPRTTINPGLSHGEPPAKKRRLSPEQDEEALKPSESSVAKSPQSTRAPLKAVQNPPSSQINRDGAQDVGIEGFYMVLWRRFTTKKNKTWDGDGVLAVRAGFASLQDIDGREIGRVPCSRQLLPGSMLSISGKDVEVDCAISTADFLAGKPFVKSQRAPAQPKTASNSTKPLQTSSTSKQPKMSLQAQMKAAMQKEREKAKQTVNTSLMVSQAGKKAFKGPVKKETFPVAIDKAKPSPVIDPSRDGAFVFKSPQHAPDGRQLVDVVMDPLLGKQLRHHQVEGVKFLYECVMGLRDFAGEGCILADDMGLGKTLQTIALLWTLLKQNPVHGIGPVVKKALIVCPVTLINNWQKEFKKWLGNDRIGVWAPDATKKLTDFTHGKVYNVMIVGYERLRGIADDLTKGAGIDIVIADEGHRLKTVKNKSAQAIQQLNTKKRVILSGTPIQNDLSEFFAMVNFVNDDILGTAKSFAKTFEDPIVRSRQPNATEKAIELGEARAEELAQSTSSFILRRTADILSKFLPPKTEYVLFCNLTPPQSKIYKEVLASPMFSSFGLGESAFQLITILKKLCNSPALLNPNSSDDEGGTADSIKNLFSSLPQHIARGLVAGASTKIRVLDNLLDTIRRRTDEKVVIVSNYTSTLDILQNLLTASGMPFLRLDGSVPASKRQSLVDDFNRTPAERNFAFLLSAKAGGVGLNLIGASRLVLFDVDWNPATENQAMARIHREGQKRRCRIYRLVVSGAIEERIWQRQIEKGQLADSIMDGGIGTDSGGSTKVNQFSKEELKDLFRLDERAGLRTHDLIGCQCDGSGMIKSGSTTPSGEISVDDVDFDDNESLPDVANLVKSSSLTNSKIERQETLIDSGKHPAQANSKRKKEKHLTTLMQYAHLDVSRVTDCEVASDEFDRLRDLVDDDCLFDMLRADDDTKAGGVGYVFKKSAKASVLKGDTTTDIEATEISSKFFQTGPEMTRRL